MMALGYLMTGYTIVGMLQRAFPKFQSCVQEYGNRSSQWHYLDPTGV